MASVSGAVGLFSPSIEDFDAPPARSRRVAPGYLYDGADPWVTRHGDCWFSCNARHDGTIEVWKSSEFCQRGIGRQVWTPPRRGWNAQQVWAPELHNLFGRWYIYYAASDGKNANHRMGVLAARTADPQGPYDDIGMLYTGDDIVGRTNNRWAIDGTPFQHRGQLYFLWSGWQDERDVQHLYIAAMDDPTRIASNRQQLAPNDCHPWERVSEDPSSRGLHEGPALLRRHGKVNLIYSCSGSWEPTYKLGLLHMPIDADPMAPGVWTKHPAPIFRPTEDVFGIGHCSFTTDAAGRDVIFYHSKKNRRAGWDRRVHAHAFSWTAEGLPDFSIPDSTGHAPKPAPRRAA
jgi:GH43 family beta-xylosidase